MRYFYAAKNYKGELRKGILDAGSEKEVALALKNDGFVLISANLEAKKMKAADFFSKLSLPGKVSQTEKIMFCRNLMVMVKAAVPLPKALKILSNQTKNKKFSKAILEASDEIVRGQTLSESLKKHSEIFSDFFYNILKSGEESGTLENSLKFLVKHMEKERKIKATIKGALVYPGFIVGVMIAIGILMMIFIVPKMAGVFESMNIELPVTTKIIIAIGTFMANQWYLVPAFMALIFLAVKILIKMKIFRPFLNRVSLKIPVLGNLVKKTNCAYTTRILGTLLSSGVPVVRSLEIVSDLLSNVVYKKAMAKVKEDVKKGAKLAEALAGYEKIYPALLTQMIEVGEETGETSSILDKVADFYEEEITVATKALMDVFEPCLMILIGIVVAVFMLSMLQPMYSVLGSIQ